MLKNSIEGKRAPQMGTGNGTGNVLMRVEKVMDKVGLRRASRRSLLKVGLLSGLGLLVAGCTKEGEGGVVELAQDKRMQADATRIAANPNMFENVGQMGDLYAERVAKATQKIIEDNKNDREMNPQIPEISISSQILQQGNIVSYTVIVSATGGSIGIPPPFINVDRVSLGTNDRCEIRYEGEGFIGHVPIEYMGVQANLYIMDLGKSGIEDIYPEIIGRLDYLILSPQMIDDLGPYGIERLIRQFSQIKIYYPVP